MFRKPTYEELEQRNRALEKKSERLRQLDGAFIGSEMKCQVMMRSLPTIVYKGFKDWSVEFTDNKVETLTGYSCEEFNLKKLKWSDIILKEDIEAAKESFILALKTRGLFARDYRVKTRSGEILWIQDRGQIIYDKKGDIKYTIGTFFDISDRKNVEEALTKQTEQLIQARKLASLGILTAGVAHELNNPLNNISTAIQIVLEELGVSLEDVNPKTNDFGKILDTLKQAGIDTTGAIKLFGQEAGPKFVKVLQAGSEGLDNFTKKLNAQRDAADAAKF